MYEPELSRAIAVAESVAASAGLSVDQATVLNNSNKLAVRLSPADVLARVAPLEQQCLQFEVELARRLAGAGCPVAEPDHWVDPQVFEADGFAVTLWAYHAPRSSAEVSPADYADTLAALHAGMRKIDFDTPHFTDRVDEALALATDRERTPDLAETERDLLIRVLRTKRRSIIERSDDQLLHGEPHPGNLLDTEQGLLFIDLETCCRGPVEFDLAHAPDEVADHYPNADPELLRDCRMLMLAMIIMWRWDRDDQLPDGRQRAFEWMQQLNGLLKTDG